MTVGQNLRLGVGAVTFQTQLVRFCRAQQVLVFSPMRLVASGAALVECGLVQIFLFVLFGLFGVTGQADVDGVRLGESRRLSSMGVMAIHAIAGGAGVLHLGFFNLLGFFRVARQAQFLGGSRRQNDFSVLGCLVATGTGILATVEGGMHERLHQLRLGRLVRIVTGEAIGAGKRLILMSLRQIGVLRVVAIHAKSRRILGQMEIGFAVAFIARLMSGVAGRATHVERHMATSALRNVDALRVAGQTEIFFLGRPRSRLKQLVLIVGYMGIVTLEAIADGRAMYAALDLGGVFVGVTLKTEAVGGGCDQLYACDLFANAYFVTARTSSRNCRMDRLPLALVLVALDALG